MLDKLTNISKRYDAINEKLSDPAVFSDREAFAALMKERKSLEPVVEKYGLYKTLEHGKPHKQRKKAYYVPNFFLKK